MTETLKYDDRAYTYEPGLDGDVVIEHATTPEIRIPGSELKQLVKQGAPRPMVGISLLILDEFEPDRLRVLLGKRMGSHGEGLWATPGGHLENGESYEDAAMRELREECGNSIMVSPPRFLCVTNLTNYLPKQYTDIGMIVRVHGGMPYNVEPDKCEGWQWFSIDELPTPRFGAVDNLVIAYHTGQFYFPGAD